MTAPHETELRSLVRSVLREALPSLTGTSASIGSTTGVTTDASAGAGVGPLQQPVSITSDADLQAFVASVIAVLDDPIMGGQLRSGRIRYHLVSQASAPTGMPVTPTPTGAPVIPPPAGVPTQPTPSTTTSAAPNSPAGVVEVESGLVSERVALAAAASGDTLVLGRRAVLTPLARDAVRRFNITVEVRP